MAISRNEAAEILAQVLPSDDVVLCGLGSTSRAWRAIGSGHLTYQASDPMGLASSLALGLALARPERNVALLGGDGDLVMNLGMLLTIANESPSNLYIFLFANRRYETGGGQPLGLREEADFAAMAAAAGILFSRSADSAASIRRDAQELRALRGPTFLCIDVKSEASPYPPSSGRWSQVEERAFFMEKMGTDGIDVAPYSQ